MAGHGEGPRRRLQEAQHGCKKHLGDIISFFFHFISGNLARGEDSLSAGRGCRAGDSARLIRGGDRQGSALGTGLGGTLIPSPDFPTVTWGTGWWPPSLTMESTT